MNAPPHGTRRVPKESLFFKWIVPAVFVLFAVLLFVIVAVSIGLLTGIIHYR